MADRSRYAPWVYLLGAAGLGAAGVLYILNRRLELAGQILLGVGVVSIAAGVLLDPDRVRAFLGGRQARYGSNALLLSFSVLGILAVLNYLAFENPRSWDLTEDRQYTLAPETISLLGELEHDVQIIGFYTPARASARENTEPLLERYQEASNGRVTMSFVDPDENPFAAQNFGVTRDATLVVEVEDRSEVLSAPTEQEITSAIVRLVNPGIRKVLFTTGHGERDIESADPDGLSQVRQALEAKNYIVERVNLLAENEIAEDTLAVVIAGPQFAFSEDEVNLLAEFASGGGALVIMYEPTVATEGGDEVDPLVGYLNSEWSVELGDNIIVDPNSNLPLFAVAFDYGSHPVTDRLGNVVTYFPTARSVAQIDTEDGPALDTLVETSQAAFAETDLSALQSEGQLGFDEGQDLEGPFALALAGTVNGTRLVVVGDSSFGTNEFFFEYANGDLFINSIDWAAGQEALLNLTPTQRTSRIVAPPSVQTVGLIFLVSILLIPGAVVVLGVSVWFQRRRTG